MEGFQHQSAISPGPGGGEGERRWLEWTVQLEELPAGLEGLVGERAGCWGESEGKEQAIARHQQIFALYRSL